MKIFNILFIVFFVFSAALQYNDPDPLVWMSIYIYGAYLCYMATKQQYNPMLYLVGLAVYISYDLYLLVDAAGVISWLTEHGGESLVKTMKADKPWIEETREFFGLMILVMVLSVNMIWLSRRKEVLINTSLEAV